MFTAVYDLAVSPISFDFVSFLIQAKMAAGNQSLHVAIEPKLDGIGGLSRDWAGYDAEEAGWRLWNIVIPACQLAGATVELRRDRGGPGERIRHSQAAIMAVSRVGVTIPQLAPSGHALRLVDGWRAAEGGRPYLTITIRRGVGAAADPARNSNREAWRAFTLGVMDRYEVIWLEDTRDALAQPAGPFATLSLDLRLALYVRAAMNFVVENGPVALLQYSAAPFMLFNCRRTNEAWNKHWDDQGLHEGAQLPWCGPDQLYVCARDNAPEISATFDAWERARRAPAESNA